MRWLLALLLVVVLLVVVVVVLLLLLPGRPLLLVLLRLGALAACRWWRRRWRWRWRRRRRHCGCALCRRARLLIKALEVAVPVVFDRVVCAARQQLGDLGPLIAQQVVLLDNDLPLQDGAGQADRR
jgi:hypothetical protein